MLPCVVSPAQCTPLPLPLWGSSSWTRLWGGTISSPLFQQEAFECYPVPSPVLVALRCHRSWGTDPQIILSPQVLGGLLHWGRVGLPVRFSIAWWRGALALGQNALFLILASPRLLWASQGTSLSLTLLVCRAGMVSLAPVTGRSNCDNGENAPSARRDQNRVSTSLPQLRGPRSPGVVTMTSRHSQLCAAQM